MYANPEPPMPAPVVQGPHSGRMLEPFELRSPDGRLVTRSAFRGRTNLVLVFHHGLDCPTCRTYLQAVAARPFDFEDRHAVLLALGPDAAGIQALAEGQSGAFVALDDAKHTAAQRYGMHVPATVVADRPGEIWALWDSRLGMDLDATSAHAGLAPLGEVLSWLDVMEIWEPECGSCLPAWPAGI